MLKLLHVDDDADILEVAKMSLELSGGFETVGCLSGEEALTIVPDYMPDVLLLDARDVRTGNIGTATRIPKSRRCTRHFYDGPRRGGQ